MRVPPLRRHTGPEELGAEGGRTIVRFGVDVTEPPVDVTLRGNVGLREEYLGSVRTAKDLRGKFGEQPNLLAHFLYRENPAPVDFSQGLSQLTPGNHPPAHDLRGSQAVG